ncbi:MAG TPA: formate dehydrogenase subunit gamma, partial [Casimicrobiaceae bacterium]|nr:formate dehydrogenase subunit gamma [Casimicrobiaceae bacterium]
MRTLKFVFAAFAVAACLAATVASAQSPATSAADADRAKQQQQRQVTQPLNNQPVWSEVRSGAPQTTTVVGRETNVLIQPEGQTWRSLRTPLLAIGGWLVALAVIGLAVFYLVRGKLDYEHKPRER